MEIGEQGCVIPTAYETFYDHDTVREAITLGPLEYMVVRNSLNNTLQVEQGPKLVFLDAYEEIEFNKRSALSLKATQFVRFIDKQTGKIRVEIGEQGCVIPTAYESLLDASGVRDAIALKCYEYVKIEDKKSGNIRVVKGEQLVFLNGFEEIVNKVSKAIEVDEEVSIIVILMYYSALLI